MAAEQPAEVLGEAIEVVVETVRRLNSQQLLPDDELEALRSELSPQEQLAGYSTMIWGLTRLIDGYPEQFTVIDGNTTGRFTSQALVPIAIGSASNSGVSKQDLPVVAGALVVASVGIAPSAWREALGPFDVRESPAWERLGPLQFVDGMRQNDGLAVGIIEDSLVGRIRNDELAEGAEVE